MKDGSERVPDDTRVPRVVGWLALAGVSLIAGVVSYFHALAVVQAAGSGPPVSYLVPALADLVILGASADLLAASRAGQDRPRLAMVALGVGVLVTLTMNVVSFHPHAMPPWLVDGWPALAFTLALESLAGLVRRGRGGAFPRENGSVPAARIVAVGCGHGVAETIPERVADAYNHLRECLGAEPSFRDLGRAFGIHHDTAGQMVKAAIGSTPAGPGEPPRPSGPAGADPPAGAMADGHVTAPAGAGLNGSTGG